MKKFILLFGLVAGLTSISGNIEAQNINIHINLDRQPEWGPVGYDYVDYYYLPDINCYYNVNAEVFHYYDRGRWIKSRRLPHVYSHYDLYGLHKVVINSPSPWKYNKRHIRDYRSYVGYRNQHVIRDYHHHDNRYNQHAWHSDRHDRYDRYDKHYNSSQTHRKENYNTNKSKNNKRSNRESVRKESDRTGRTDRSVAQSRRQR